MQIGIIGSNSACCNDELYNFAYELGLYLSDKGVTVINGGMNGTMEAVAKGIRKGKNKTSTVVGVLPESSLQKGNKYLDIKIPTGIGFARNTVIILSSDILIALGGGAGTLSELSYAWQYGKTVYCYEGAEGWSKDLIGKDLDKRNQNLFIGFDNLKKLDSLLFNE
ncbi:MAG: TIGR00725 family protein [Bacteroidia bacterium]